MTVEIVEVLERSVQGRTRPYVCRGDDGDIYFVKGRAATRKGLIAEFVCAELAHRMRLPIAPYCLGYVGDDLIAASTDGYLADLGAGAVFASRRVVAVEFAPGHVELTPKDLAADIFLFDWWIHNGDRNLTYLGGNPNLLWDPSAETPVVIDHNLAFDDTVRGEDLRNHHVFSFGGPAALSDYIWCEQVKGRMWAALADWEEICAGIPEGWNFVDDERTIPVDFSLTEQLAKLRRPLEADFWQLRP